MKNPWFYFGIIFFVIVVTILIPKGASEYDSFASCLTEKGVTMYGTEWCPHCKNQKALFGDSFNNVDYVDCDSDRNACTSAGVRGYPTWKINGQNYPGEQSLERLAILTGCELVKDK